MVHSVIPSHRRVRQGDCLGHKKKLCLNKQTNRKRKKNFYLSNKLLLLLYNLNKLYDAILNLSFHINFKSFKYFEHNFHCPKTLYCQYLMGNIAIRIKAKENTSLGYKN